MVSVLLSPMTYLSPQIEFEFTTAPQTPRSLSSSPTLYNPSQRHSFFAPTTPVDSRPTSVNHLSVLYRSFVETGRQSVHSVVAYRDERSSQDIITVRRS